MTHLQKCNEIRYSRMSGAHVVKAVDAEIRSLQFLNEVTSFNFVVRARTLLLRNVVLSMRRCICIHGVTVLRARL
jgi:hypothetical protein